MSIKYSNTMVINAGIDTCGSLGRSKVLLGNENISIKLVSKGKGALIVPVTDFGLFKNFL